MAFFKVVHFFRDVSDGLGWSEVWYVEAANFDQAEASGENIATTRTRLLARDIILEWQRVIGNQPATTAARPRQPRAAVLQRLNKPGIYPGVIGAFSDFTTTCVKVRWAANAVEKFRTQLLRGIPDDLFQNGDDKNAAAAVGQWIVPMVQTLQNNSARIRHTLAIVPPNTFRVYEFNAPVRGTYEGYTRRATGRPFGLPRGRRANRPAP